jgi:chromosome segregation ATPase
MKSIESENSKLHLDIDVLNSKIKSIDREKQDITVKLEYFTHSEERRKKKKKLNESYEDVLIEQFDNMKRSYQEEIEKIRKEIIHLKLEHKKVIAKLEMENEELRNRNHVYYKQIEDLKLKLF